MANTRNTKRFNMYIAGVEYWNNEADAAAVRGDSKARNRALRSVEACAKLAHSIPA